MREYVHRAEHEPREYPSCNSADACFHLQVVFFDLGADGVELRRFTPHSCQLFLVRCRSMDDEHVCKNMNTRVVAAIPGPRQPKAGQWAAVVVKILSIFDCNLKDPTAGMTRAYSWLECLLLSLGLSADCYKLALRKARAAHKAGSVRSQKGLQISRVLPCAHNKVTRLWHSLGSYACAVPCCRWHQCCTLEIIT